MNTTLENYDSEGLNKKLKLMGEAMNFFSKRLLGHEIFSSMAPWATKHFWKNLENPPTPTLTYLMYTP